MSDTRTEQQQAAVEDLYAESDHWQVNTGGEAIHAKRLPGKWRNLKWVAASVWLIWFLGPYLRWEGRQAVLWDIPNRQFHIFGVTILPQDFWMLSLLLLFFAILLAVVTAVAGRVWCGYFCFQTVWTDWFTWIEEKLEGSPQKRRKLDKAKLDFAKFRTKFLKHSLWLAIGLLTGLSGVAWFTDAPTLWVIFFTGQAHVAAYVTVILFTVGTYVLAGYLREQACFWLCPYARIQGVMVDKTTVLPTYDFHRGEPRGRIRKGRKKDDGIKGDCVDCNQCVAVCPTGVDIRHGQQEGCITCALCIDACDQVMEKVGRSKGLIRYASLEELDGKTVKPLLKRPRVWVYFAILMLAWTGILFGLNSLDAIQLKVLHERQPLFVLQSDGSIQNKYTLKMLNKQTEDLELMISASGPENLVLVGADKAVTARNGTVSSSTVFVRVPRKNLAEESAPIVFRVQGVGRGGELLSSERKSVFIGPRS